METLSQDLEVGRGDSKSTKTALVMTKTPKRHGEQESGIAHSPQRRTTSTTRNIHVYAVIAGLILVIFLINAEYGRRQQATLAKFEQLQAVNMENINRMAREQADRDAAHAEVVRKLLDEAAANRKAEREIEEERQEKWKAREKLAEEQQKGGWLEGWSRLSPRQKVTAVTAGAAGVGSLTYYAKKAAEYASKGNKHLEVAARVLPVAVNFIGNLVLA